LFSPSHGLRKIQHRNKRHGDALNTAQPAIGQSEGFPLSPASGAAGVGHSGPFEQNAIFPCPMIAETKKTSAVESQMLNALELFHYESRFRERVFVIALEEEIPLEAILSDLRVIQASDIQIILFCRQTVSMAENLAELNQRGYKFRHYKHPLGKDITKTFNNVIRRDLTQGAIPLIALEGQVDDSDPKKPLSTRAETAKAFALQALDTAQDFAARKVFFLSSFRGLEVDGVLQSHPSEREIHSFLEGNSSINIGKEQLAFIQEQFVDRGIEIVLLEGRSGNLFLEIFSHLGKGTLFTEDYPNVTRRAVLADVTDIALLMKPGVASGVILPVSESDLAETIDTYFVYTVNGAIVAAARLADYGEASELAKFSTLPRFQGKGRARQLAIEMIDAARIVGKTYVFALSIETKMWQFFEGLGFREVPRETLPDQWKSKYDFSRPSKSFRLDL
jgi:N-acetylglutamate synthase-like GNAT family acetyltransferase